MEKALDASAIFVGGTVDSIEMHDRDGITRKDPTIIGPVTWVVSRAAR